jgi:hypothetical protein
MAHGTGYRPEALTDGGASVAQSKEHRARGAWHREVAGEEGLGMGGIGMGFVVGY